MEDKVFAGFISAHGFIPGISGPNLPVATNLCVGRDSDVVEGVHIANIRQKVMKMYQTGIIVTL